MTTERIISWSILAVNAIVGFLLGRALRRATARTGIHPYKRRSQP